MAVEDQFQIFHLELHFGTSVAHSDQKSTEENIHQIENNVNSSTSETDMYILQPQIWCNFNSLLWWKNSATKYKILAELARKYLSIFAMFVSSEKLLLSAENTNVIVYYSRTLIYC
ncbi:uncharacterized protein LOC143148367 [Ptiloglossa arizonensis]|uniref:uncharacterized protein LOC143148367 n=1 Tax=Ptiloglossa arizonensis TaxID=3350558 RepID=UPI003FA10B52